MCTLLPGGQFLYNLHVSETHLPFWDWTIFTLHDIPQIFSSFYIATNSHFEEKQHSGSHLLYCLCISRHLDPLILLLCIVLQWTSVFTWILSMILNMHVREHRIIVFIQLFLLMPSPSWLPPQPNNAVEPQEFIWHKIQTQFLVIHLNKVWRLW